MLLLLFCCMKTVYAEETFSLRSGERVLDSQMQRNGVLEQFTLYEGQYYRRLLMKTNDQWNLLSEEEITLPPAGLSETSADLDVIPDAIFRRKLADEGLHLARKLPPRLDYSSSPYLPPIGEQHENSCVGWAAGYYLRTYQEARERQKAVGTDPKKIFSPSFIYNQINKGKDEGSTLIDAGNLLKQKGAATIEAFPYVPQDYLSQPNEETTASAYPHRIKEWGIIYTSKDSKEYILRRTKEYLMTGDLPIVGINIGFKWKYPYEDEQGRIIITTDQHIFGGHAVAIVGYDDELPTPEGKGAFKIINSYGKEWGMEGYAYITYDAFVRNLQETYIYTDLPTISLEDLELQVHGGQEFRIQFRREGAYDLYIVDSQGKTIRKITGLTAVSGENIYFWEGTDDQSQPVADGNYEVQIYHSGQKIFSKPFVLRRKLRTAAVKKQFKEGKEDFLIELLFEEKARIRILEEEKLLHEGQYDPGMHQILISGEQISAESDKLQIFVE